MLKRLIPLVTHATMLAVGFAGGIYMLPILTAPASPSHAELEQMAEGAVYQADFTRDLRGNDLLHWGEGTISLTETQIVHKGRLAPGPDYKLYLVSEFVEHEDEFLPLKDSALQLGDVKSFDGFVFDLPADVDLKSYTTVLIWCEAFSEFITAAKYR